MVHKYEFHETEIAGLWKIDSFWADDIRGYLVKDYSREAFAQNGITYDLKEVFYTNSFKGVIRALHFQREKQQPKLVRCVWGHIYDVVVDLRKDSPTFRKWLGFDLSEENKQELLIPGGCAHGYLVLEHSIVSYKCAEKFYGQYDGGILWNDPEIGVDWPLEKIGGADQLILAEKDMQLPSLAHFLEEFGGL